jgi:hypothetical protein
MSQVEENNTEGMVREPKVRLTEISSIVDIPVVSQQVFRKFGF